MITKQFLSQNQGFSLFYFNQLLHLFTFRLRNCVKGKGIVSQYNIPQSYCSSWICVLQCHIVHLLKTSEFPSTHSISTKSNSKKVNHKMNAVTKQRIKIIKIAMRWKLKWLLSISHNFSLSSLTIIYQCSHYQ